MGLNANDTADLGSSWIQTFSGHKFYFQREWYESDDIYIADIVWALSRCPRYCGHTNVFYSVAQHCVLVSEEVARRGGGVLDQLIGLLHDAPEAYLADLPSPLKALCPQYKAIEDGVWARISHRFLGEVIEIPPIVKECDLALLTAEAEDCFSYAPLDNLVSRYSARADITIEPCSSEDASGLYLLRFNMLIDAYNDSCSSTEITAAAC